MKRRFLAIAALLPALLLAGCGGSKDDTSDTVTIDDLMAPQPLADEWLGSADAPVTVIEYASLNCPHCRAFHEDVFPDFVAEFVDTGRVRFALREFPLNERAVAAIMLARCAPGDNGFYSLVGHLFDTQSDWALVDPRTSSTRCSARSNRPVLRGIVLMHACRIRNFSTTSPRSKITHSGLGLMQRRPSSSTARSMWASSAWSSCALPSRMPRPARGRR